MYRVAVCLTENHNLWLILLAAAVCACTALTAFRVYAIAREADDARRLFWVLLAGICAGVGIWSTHFVAMLGFEGGFPVTYDASATLASLIVSVSLAVSALALAVQGGTLQVATGGALLGGAVGAMHYIGMGALVVPGRLTWDGDLVAASLVLGVGFGCAALTRIHADGRHAMPAGAGLLALAICGLHFTSMGAVGIDLDPTIAFQDSSLDNTLLAVATAGVTLIVLLAAHAAAAINTVHVRCEHALQQQNDLFVTALEHLPVGVSMYDPEHRLIICNPAYRSVYRLPDDAAQPGTSFDVLLQHGASGDEVEQRHLAAWRAEHLARLAKGDVFADEQSLADVRTISVRVAPMTNGGWVDVQEDITDRVSQEAKIVHMARHDMLTGLPNRAQLEERLDSAIAERGASVTVLFLDLDRFKQVNDTLGHRIGDELLKSVAIRLRSCVRGADLVARVGGDEFVVLVSAHAQPIKIDVLAERVIESISAPYLIDGQPISVGASVGIAASNGGAVSGDALLAQADLALYRSKSDGRGTFRYFEEAMDTEARTRRSLEQDLRSALAKGQFELDYQPLVNIDRNEIAGFEALLKWRHPERGLVSPAEFVPIAEDTGLITPIGAWVLRQACADAAQWPAHVKISVNLSPVQFKCRDLMQTVFSALANSGIAAERLVLEITESALLNDGEATLETLHQLRRLGAAIAMDDFGTGYSSLSYLHRFPFSKIKIDRCFIRELADDGNSLAIVRAVVGLGESLNLSVTAEGVETEEQLALIRREGCSEMQGYLFSKPKPAAAFAKYFEVEGKATPVRDVDAPAVAAA